MTDNSLMNVNTVPDVDTAIEQWNAYQRLCGKEGILNETDYQKIWVKEKDEHGKYHVVQREFKKKSAWQKLARAFNVNTSIVEKELIQTKTGRINEAYYCVRATLPNGRSVESDALCNRSEKGKSNIKDHDIMSIAKTRATNRAIAELIGAGEVSSEEITPSNPPKKEDAVEGGHVEVIPAKVSEPQSALEPNPERPPAPPKLITDCIDALAARGMMITNATVMTCIETRCRDEQELRECKAYLDSINLEEAE